MAAKDIGKPHNPGLIFYVNCIPSLTWRARVRGYGITDELLSNTCVISYFKTEIKYNTRKRRSP